ncbi:MAG: hypothetical protein ACI87J_001729 [Colwellia sp.]
MKLEAIHHELIGIVLYLISFATLWISIILDSGVNMMNLAKSAAARSREIKSFKGSNLNTSEDELKSFIERINVRDFGIKR